MHAPVTGLTASTRAVGAASRISSNIHGGGHEAIGVALLGDIADARESEVIADECELIPHRHIENPLACLGGHPGIGVKVKCPIGMVEGNRGVSD